MFKVDGIDYSPEGIEAVRQQLVIYREEAMKQWPGGIEVSLVLSHTIALLAGMKELVENV